MHMRRREAQGPRYLTQELASSQLARLRLGRLHIFGEPLRPLWFLGASVIALGVFLVAKAAPAAMPATEDDTARQKKGD